MCSGNNVRLYVNAENMRLPLCFAFNDYATSLFRYTFFLAFAFPFEIQLFFETISYELTSVVRLLVDQKFEFAWMWFDWMVNNQPTGNRKSVCEWCENGTSISTALLRYMAVGIMLACLIMVVFKTKLLRRPNKMFSLVSNLINSCRSPPRNANRNGLFYQMN